VASPITDEINPFVQVEPACRKAAEQYFICPLFLRFQETLYEPSPMRIIASGTISSKLLRVGKAVIYSL